MVERIHDDPQAFWGDAMAAEEPLREARFPLVALQTEIAWRVIEPLLDGRHSLLDAGAGTGRYSLPIAARGLRVTHLDPSAAMLANAQAAAARQGLACIEFVRGDVRDLSVLGGRRFDLTLCLDAPLSYAWPEHERALAEVCRATRDVLVVMVSSRSGVLPFLMDYDLRGDFTPPHATGPRDPFFVSESIWRHGVERIPEEDRNWLAAQGRLTPPEYAFTPQELTRLLRREGFVVERLGGPGALARSVQPETLARIRGDRALLERFLDYSLEFDFDPHNAGLGAVNLLAIARRARHPARPIRRKARGSRRR